MRSSPHAPRSPPVGMPSPAFPKEKNPLHWEPNGAAAGEEEVGLAKQMLTKSFLYDEIFITLHQHGKRTVYVLPAGKIPIDSKQFPSPHQHGSIGKPKAAPPDPKPPRSSGVHVPISLMEKLRPREDTAFPGLCSKPHTCSRAG